MTCVKICGIRDEVHALAAIKAGADFVGLVLAPSSRQVTVARACEIARTVKANSAKTQVVGVFVNMPASRVNEIADRCLLDWVQLSGDEPWEYCLEINRPVIKAIRVGLQPFSELDNALSAGNRLLSAKRFVALLDTYVEGKYGGTGESFDWDLAKQLARKFPVIIAGGLNPDNVASLIKKVKPWGVDVSSGVETGGIKDIAKINAFIAAVRKTDEERETTA